MGRVSKYKNEDELREARKRQKREWYANHRDVVNNRRARKRRDGRKSTPSLEFIEGSSPSAQPTLPSASFDSERSGSERSGTPETDRAEDESCRAATRVKIPGCIPSSLAQDIEDALLLAPDPKQVDDGCTYWRTFIQSFTRDNLVALARTIFFDLFKMADNDYVKDRAYTRLAKKLYTMEKTVHSIFRNALDADPHGRGSAYHFAEHLDKKAEHLSEVIREMIYYRQDGIDCLVGKAQRGDLVYRLM